MSTMDKLREARARQERFHQQAIERKRYFPTARDRLKHDEKRLLALRITLQDSRIALSDALVTVKRLTETVIPKLQQEIPNLEKAYTALSKRLLREKPKLECQEKIQKLKTEIARLRRGLGK